MQVVLVLFCGQKMNRSVLQSNIKCLRLVLLRGEINWLKIKGLRPSQLTSQYVVTYLFLHVDWINQRFYSTNVQQYILQEYHELLLKYILLKEICHESKNP